MQAETKYENARQYYIRIPETNFDGRDVPDVLVNRIRKNGSIECQTLDLIKLNQRISDSHAEVVLTSDKTIQDLLQNIRGEIASLFKVCESIAVLDMIAAFAHSAIANDYVKPEIGDCLMIEAGRHPVKEKVSNLSHHRMATFTKTC
jgi:DNA mismatch repair protein MSH4